MLKHIRDIRSPIVVAQQKHAARKANEAHSTSGKSNSGPSHGRSVSRPTAKINPNTPPLTTSTTTQGSWPELMSPAVEHKDKLDESLRNQAAGSSTSGGTTDHEAGDSSHGGGRQDVITGEMSYAVAIYPYMAEQDDEFDVVV